jgi:hypothetical protein
LILCFTSIFHAFFQTFFNAKMGNMDEHVDALGEILGSRDEAMKMVIADQIEREIQVPMGREIQQLVAQDRT